MDLESSLRVENVRESLSNTEKILLEDRLFTNRPSPAPRSAGRVSLARSEKLIPCLPPKKIEQLNRLVIRKSRLLGSFIVFFRISRYRLSQGPFPSHDSIGNSQPTSPDTIEAPCVAEGTMQDECGVGWLVACL